MLCVLVIEDEDRVRSSLEEGLRTAGFEVQTAATGNEGSRLAVAQPQRGGGVFGIELGGEHSVTSRFFAAFQFESERHDFGENR